MTKRKEVYKCLVCGNIVEVLHEGAGELVCCGQAMKLQVENTVDAAVEHRSVDPELRIVGAKHVPVIEGKKVKVGEVEHPMAEEHFIEWIEGTSEKGEVDKVFLRAGDKPEVEFCFEVVSVRAYCNLHGLWKSGN